MAEIQLTGLQKRAQKYLNRRISHQVQPGEIIQGNFVGFDKVSPDRAVIQMSNAADRMTLPLMYVVNFFIEEDERKNEEAND